MTMSAQPSSLPARRQERGTAAQRKMVEAAEALIAEGGLGHATMARIGERAGYSRGLADYHFASKSEIVEKIIDHIAAGWLQTIQAPARRRSSRPSDRRWRATTKPTENDCAAGSSKRKTMAQHAPMSTPSRHLWSSRVCCAASVINGCSIPKPADPVRWCRPYSTRCSA